MLANPTQLPEFDRDSELAFVRAVLAEKEQAIVQFERRMGCVPRILRALNRRRGLPLNEHDVADLAQDTVLIVLRKLEHFEALAPLEGWVFRLCYLEFLNAVRRTRRQLERTSEWVDRADEHATDGHGHDDVHRALEQLGGVEAEVIHLKHFGELTFQEIGERMDLPANTAKTRYYRGLAKLGALLRTIRRREDSR